VIPRPANFAMVDDRVWRGSRPDAYQARDLVQAGAWTVIDLEWEDDDRGLWPRSVNLVRVRDFEPLPFFAPSLADAHVIAALKAIMAGPAVVYVHCRSGQNRTGVGVAAYRLIELGQPVDAVIADFKKFRGFWAWADESYIRSIAERREWFKARVEA